MSTDGFGFPLPTEETVSEEARRVELTYKNQPPEFFRDRADDLSSRGAKTSSDGTRLAEGQPIAVFAGGGSGSGKSVIAASVFKTQLGPGQAFWIIDPDHYKKIIPEYERLRELGHPGAASIVHAESKQLSLLGLNIVLGLLSQFNLLYDSTLADKNANLPRLQRARDAGHHIRIIAATVRPDTALRRVLARGQETGRYVSPATVLSTHKHFSRSFDAYKAACDSYALYDNNSTPAQVKLIVSKKKGEAERVDNQALLDEFYRYGDLNEDAQNFDEIGL